MPRGWRRHVLHRADDLARRAKLPVLAGGGDLAEQVFVEIARGVVVLPERRLRNVHAGLYDYGFILRPGLEATGFGSALATARLPGRDGSYVIFAAAAPA